MTAITTRSIDVQSCSLSINGVDVSDNVIKVTFPSSWINNDVTAFGSVGRRYNAGIDETKFTVEMMFNQVATTGSHTVVGAVHTAKTTVPFAFYPATSGSGNTKISGNISIPKYEITSQVGAIVKVTAECWVDNGITWAAATTNYVFTPSYDGYLLNSGSVYATVQGAATGSVSDASPAIDIGQIYAFGSTYQIERAFYMFDTSALVGKTPTAAYLNLNVATDASDTDFTLTVTHGGTTYPHNPAVAGDYAIANYASSGGTLSTSGLAIGYNQINLNATGLTWLNLTGTTKLIVVSSRDVAVTTPTGNEYIIVYSRLATGYVPQLVVSA